MAKSNMEKVIDNYKSKFFIDGRKIKAIHDKYIKEFNLSFKAAGGKNPQGFVENILKFMMENEFDSNFIRAVFGQESKDEPIYKEEINVFINIWLNKMLKK